jgi:hypothetical protein
VFVSPTPQTSLSCFTPCSLPRSSASFLCATYSCARISRSILLSSALCFSEIWGGGEILHTSQSGSMTGAGWEMEGVNGGWADDEEAEDDGVALDGEDDNGDGE